jgi:hypothetical protein
MHLPIILKKIGITLELYHIKFTQTKMTEIIPSLPDAHIVRTYKRDYADTDTESKEKTHCELDTGDEEKCSISS